MPTGLGLGLKLQFGGSASFDPLSLFTGGQLGAWYDPSDLTSMFQDSAGTTPAVVDSPVGKINDKSGNGYHLTQGTSSARPVLRLASGLYYLEFDGVDDALLASGAGLDLMKGIGAASLFSAFTTSSLVAALRPAIGWSINGAINTRVALLTNNADLTAGGRRLDADAFASISDATVLTANVPVLGSALISWATTTLTLRRARAQVAQTTSFGTAGSTTNLSSQVGGLSFQGASAPLAGRVYGAIALQRIPDAATIANVENYIGAKAGV